MTRPQDGDVPDTGPRRYRDLAGWSPFLLTPVADYAEEPACYRRLLESHGRRAPRFAIPGQGALITEVGAALNRAHARLDGLSASLERYARHTAKVLAKCYQPEERKIAKRDLVNHAARPDSSA